MAPSTGIDPVLGAPQTPVLPLHQDGKRKQGHYGPVIDRQYYIILCCLFLSCGQQDYCWYKQCKQCTVHVVDW